MDGRFIVVVQFPATSVYEFQSLSLVSNFICMGQNDAVCSGQGQYKLSTNQAYTQYMTWINVFIPLNPGSIRTYAMTEASSPLMMRFRVCWAERMLNACKGWGVKTTHTVTPIHLHPSPGIHWHATHSWTQPHTHTHTGPSAWGRYYSAVHILSV